MKQCEFVDKDGGQCRAKPTKGSNYCFWHDPALQKIRMLASTKGGLNRRLQGLYGNAVKITTPKSITKFLGMVINDVWTGKVPVQVGTSMGFLTRCWLDSYEASEVNDRLKDLEEKISQQNV